MKLSRSIPWLLAATISAFSAAQAAGEVPVAYQLPVTGALPQTYRVTLAIVDPKNPNWIISQFAAGVPRTVTAENKGKFTENWDGLDDNFMPVPPGKYAVRGIYMPASKWEVDGEYHTVTPKFHSGASAWLPSPEQWQTPEPFGGDPVGSPLRDVDVAANGIAVFYYQYLENGTNNPLIDLKKPDGLGQFVRAFRSGGAAGGSSATTDGENVWASSTDGGPQFIYRADGKSFGESPGANRSNGYLAAGTVTAMAVWKNAAGAAFVFDAQRGKIVQDGRHYRESDTSVDLITVHDGVNGKVLKQWPLARPRALAVQGNRLYAMGAEGGASFVSVMDLTDTVVDGAWKRLFTVPAAIKPADMVVDSHGRFYLSDSEANKVYQVDGAGKVLRTFGKLAAQKPGSYDPDSFMAPEKMATWKDDAGNDRLIVVEMAGPNRASEWSAEGKRIRDFMTLQTQANSGYGIDPDNPTELYLMGQRDWLTRFKLDYAKHTWTVDAVWPNVGNDPRSPELNKPRCIRYKGNLYLAGTQSFNVYRLDAAGWKLSAAVLPTPTQADKEAALFWHDANNDGQIQDEETSPGKLPRGFKSYHGQNWLQDLSLLAIQQNSDGVWRLAPTSFDAHGNPVFTEWKQVLRDPVFVARAAGTADAVHGGNELTQTYNSDWMQADGSVEEGFYIQARGGKNFSANEGAQYKLSRYIPDGAGGYKLVWRTGRAALQGIAKPGEMYGAMRLEKAINGLVAVVDQSRMGILLYTQDGFYVDTLFPDGKKYNSSNVGLYAQPGEFFVGSTFANKLDKKIYFLLGKITPLIFEAQGWSLTENPVKPLTTVQPDVTIAANQIATPAEIILSLRGGAGTAKLARFGPALGGVALDGSMKGWTSADPVVFQADKDQNVEVRPLYDPDHLYFRWHARLGSKFVPRPMPNPERVFTHDQNADTLSFYIQGDPAAPANGAPGGRPGDARFVFGLFKDGETLKPVAVGFYPEWKGPGAKPAVYRTPVGTTQFAHAGPVPGAQMGYTLDEDGKGFVLAVSIPRAAVPRATQSFSGGLRTMVNFEATYGGHGKFWWANSDGSASRETFDEPTEARLYPGSWAPAQFAGLDNGVLVRNWQILGPFGGPGTEEFKADPNGNMPGTRKEMKVAVRELMEKTAFPPDTEGINLNAKYSGPIINGYWNKLNTIGWRPAEVASLDTRVLLGNGGQVWYGATWIHVPAATELEFQFQGHSQTYFRWSLNGQPVDIADKDYQPVNNILRIAKKTLTLKEGWNQIAFRGYCTGYAPFRAGLVLNGPQEKLWTLGFSSTPPTPAN